MPELSYPRILAANGPKMLALAAEIADGTLPILVPPQYTANARQVLGPDKILAVGLTVMAGIRQHLDAGADHVRVGTIAPDFQAALKSLERLGPALAR